MTAVDRDSFNPAELLGMLEQAWAADRDDVLATRNLGIMLNRMGRMDAAEDTLRRALALDPSDASTRYALAQNLLGQGRYEEGWPLYAAREGAEGPARSGIPRNLNLPRWSGEPLAGRRVIVLPEQGLGDQIQFARFVPLLPDRGATVTLLAHPALADLFASSFRSVTVIPATNPVKLTDFDIWCALGDLPVVLNASPASLPQPPYLMTRQRWTAPPSGFKTGIVTAGQAGHITDRFRSLAEPEAASLLQRLPGQVVDLRPDQTGVRDFAQTAALINELDLVVSVDTSVAHLAGALDKPCFLLLPGFNTDWRWMRGRRDSPWYPRHRLYRGLEHGGWGDAIDRLVADAEAFACEHSAYAPHA